MSTPIKDEIDSESDTTEQQTENCKTPVGSKAPAKDLTSELWDKYNAEKAENTSQTPTPEEEAKAVLAEYSKFLDKCHKTVCDQQLKAETKLKDVGSLLKEFNTIIGTTWK